MFRDIKETNKNSFERFFVKCCIKRVEIATAFGQNKKMAKLQVAYEALQKIGPELLEDWLKLNSKKMESEYSSSTSSTPLKALSQNNEDPDDCDIDDVNLLNYASLT